VGQSVRQRRFSCNMHKTRSNGRATLKPLNQRSRRPLFTRAQHEPFRSSKPLSYPSQNLPPKRIGRRCHPTTRGPCPSEVKNLREVKLSKPTFSTPRKITKSSASSRKMMTPKNSAVASRKNHQRGRSGSRREVPRDRIPTQLYLRKSQHPRTP
jgi:hypothetical protein